MEFEEEDYPNVDLLKWGRLLIVDIFEYKIMKLLVILVLILNVVLLLVQTYCFITVFEGSYFLLYSPFYFGTSFIIVSIVGILAATDDVKRSFQSLKLWKFQYADSKTFDKIKFEAKLTTAYFVVNTILAIISGFFHMFPSEKEKIFFFGFDLIEKYAPEWKNLLFLVYRANYFLVALVMPASCNQLIYMIIQMRFQIYIVLNFAETLDNIEDGKDELELFYDDEFQRQIREKLIIVAKRHHVIKQTGMDLRKKNNWLIVLFSLTAIALGLSILIFFYTFEGDLSVSFVRIGLLVLAGSSTGLATVIAGQELENIGDDFVDTMTFVKWYLWNKENKKIYLILHSNAIKLYRFQFTDNVAVNYELGVSIGRALYSMVSVLNQLK